MVPGLALRQADPNAVAVLGCCRFKQPPQGAVVDQGAAQRLEAADRLDAAGLDTSQLMFMQSNGGLVEEAGFRGSYVYWEEEDEDGEDSLLDAKTVTVEAGKTTGVDFDLLGIEQRCLKLTLDYQPLENSMSSQKQNWV